MRATDLRGWGTLLVLAVVSLGAGRDLRVVEAAKKADKAAIRALLKQGADVNAPQADGATALHWAAHWDDVDTANVLIRAGASVNAANDLGVTPLWLACLNGSRAMVERLLTAGANPNIALPSGETPLMTASRTGNVDVVKLLLAHAADANAKEGSQGQTALMWAVAQEHPTVVEALLEIGADVRARSEVRRRRVNTETGGFNNRGVIDIDQGGYTPLLFAAREGDLESAKLLVAAGADVNDTAPEGTSALVVAAHSGHGTLGVFLLDKGADPNAAAAGYAALHAAILHHDVELAKALMAHGANPNAPLIKGTPARRASADYVLDVGLIGATPFWLAARFTQPDLMRLLAARGADPLFLMKDGTTPLMAVMQGTRRQEPGIAADPVEDERIMLEAIKVAVEFGTDVNAANKDGNTALHTAASKGLNTVIQFLADKGARLDATNQKGQTPLALVEAGGRGAGGNTRSTADLLRKLGAKE